ncbi:FIG00798637: hypothetical protein [hydrothermal vent metagenome]|uniref:DUF2782 domain-containing protein n=1 Tax=hydrothermal vent metagenome TaxID=652676 RepID=A0A3B0Z7D6_9ZZZZ
MKKYIFCVSKVCIIAVCVFLATLSVAEENQSLEPEVTIIDDGGHTIEEYRLNGRLYMIKVIPAVGPHYFLVDNDGDGELETQRHLDDGEMVVPRWTLLEW